MRRRGQAAEPPERLFINELVCEDCGDCGVKSNCLSLFPVQTEFGRKTQIHQSSCNKDYSCLDGDCPSFIRVIPPASGSGPERPPIPTSPLPEPRRGPPSGELYLLGIGGTGVVTASQILGTAAALEGKQVWGLDQTGLSQKGGPVVSHLKISPELQDASNRVGAGQATAYLAFDILTAAASAHLARAHPERTPAIVSTSLIPTGSMLRSIDERFPETDALVQRIEKHTRAADNVYLDAVALAEHFFGDHMGANIVVLGAAYQRGLLPLQETSIEDAIRANGVAVDMNLSAFRVGRPAVADPEWLRSLIIRRAGALDTTQTENRTARSIVDATGAEGEVKRLLDVQVPELIDYQNEAYAHEYAGFVTETWQKERAVAPEQTRLSEAVARYLFKLMAYKDEYEVARLHAKPEVGQALEREFGRGARVQLLLHPPILRAMGWRRKIAFGRWFLPFLSLLAKLKFLRGTALETLSPDTYDRAATRAELPDLVRGYEDVKLRNVERFRQAMTGI